MAIDGWVPDEVVARMSDTLRTVLSSVVVTAAPPNPAKAAQANAAAAAAATEADAALDADKPLLWRRAGHLAMLAAMYAEGAPAVDAKHWNVSSTYPNWEDFKKAKPSAGKDYGGHLLLTHQGMPLTEDAPPAWSAQERVRLKMGVPVRRQTGEESDFEMIIYYAACRRRMAEVIIQNRRWGYNNVWASGLRDWAKVEDADVNMITMDNTVLVNFTFIVTPVG